jgi:hypothetical protein
MQATTLLSLSVPISTFAALRLTPLHQILDILLFICIPPRAFFGWFAKCNNTDAQVADILVHL